MEPLTSRAITISTFLECSVPSEFGFASTESATLVPSSTHKSNDVDILIILFNMTGLLIGVQVQK